MKSTLAAKVIEGFHSQGWQPLGRGGTWAGAMRPLEIYIQRKVERAVQAEREACAKVCEELDKKSADGEWGDYLAGWSDGTDDCAAAIRARSNP